VESSIPVPASPQQHMLQATSLDNQFLALMECQLGDQFMTLLGNLWHTHITRAHTLDLSTPPHILAVQLH
jgi:hypothetical protein